MKLLVWWLFIVQVISSEISGAIILFLGESLSLNSIQTEFKQYVKDLGYSVKHEYDTIFKGMAIEFPYPMTEFDFDALEGSLKQFRWKELQNDGITLDVSPDSTVDIMS